MKRWMMVALTACVFTLSACDAEKVEVLKSPCAGVEGSPCGPKRPVNGAYHHEASRADSLANIPG